MGYTIAIAGKGGTGKTTIAALMVRIIKEAKLGSILAVDADPNSNLAESLGVKIKETVGSLIDAVAAHPEKVPAGISKDRFIEYEVQTAITEAEGFDLLAMGRPEGPGCYCYANNVLRNIISKLVGEYDYVVIDNEAGLEHLSRRTTRAADTLLVISDASQVGLKSAKRINALIDELKIGAKKRFLLVNRCRHGLDKKVIRDLGLDYAGNIPEDKNITRISLSGSSIMDLKDNTQGLNALRKTKDRILCLKN